LNQAQKETEETRRMLRHGVNHNHAVLSDAAQTALAELEAALVRATCMTPLPMRQSQENRNKRGGGAVIACEQLNRRIAAELLSVDGWRQEHAIGHGRLKVDFYKSGVLVEVQFGKYAFIAENLFCKYPLAIKTASVPVEIGVLVVPSQRMATYMSSGVGTYELTLRNYLEPLASRIDYNLLVLGLEPPTPIFCKNDNDDNATRLPLFAGTVGSGPVDVQIDCSYG
jgi:hypothetical protein